MDPSSNDILQMTFRRSVREDMAALSLDGQMLSVLMELDGRKPTAAVAQGLNMDSDTIRTVLTRLSKLQLVEKVEPKVSLLSAAFIDVLHRELSFAIGPIASIVIEDSAKDLGHDLARFPRHRAADLVHLIAQDIKRDARQLQFKQNMLAYLKSNS